MYQPPAHARDPIGWTAFVVLAFVVLCAIRLTIPTKPFFDEIHYLPPARAVLQLSHPMNPEHPPLGKQVIAFGIALFGDRPLGWRIMSVMFGTLALFSAMRAMWFASLSRFATVACGVLLVSGFALVVQSRIAMLDIFMLGFTMFGLWMCAGALREPETARRRLILAGIAFGCAVGSKWNAAPVLMLAGLTFLVVRVRSAGWRFLIARRGAPVPGITLIEAALWLGLMPLVVYAACYWPFFFFKTGSIPVAGLIEQHRKMLALQEQLLKHHTYESVWYQWVINWRPIWYLYENVNGAQRGTIMLGNPLTMLLGLPALLWCAWAGVARHRRDALGVCLLYLGSLALWIVAAKNVQFYYHYLLPGCFLLGALALALDEFWRRGQRWIPIAVLLAAVALFAHFYPILSAARLGHPQAFLHWMWLDSWR